MNPYQNHAAMQGHIANWQASRLSQTEYCKAHDIKQHIFSYYKKKFGSSVNSCSQLIPVQLLADDSVVANGVSNCNVLKLTHANGFSLDINPHADLASLKPLLELLRSVS
jgi:hypothetical protein